MFAPEPKIVYFVQNVSYNFFEEQSVSPIEICGEFTWDMKCIFEKR